MISFDRIILNHLDLLTNSTPSRNLPTFHACDGSSRMNGRLLVMIRNCTKMWKSWMWKSRKYPKIWKCQLKKVDDFELQHHNIGKRMERLVLQSGNVQKQNVSRISASRAPFLRPMQPESKVFHGMFWVCLHGLGKSTWSAKAGNYIPNHGPNRHNFDQTELWSWVMHGLSMSYTRSQMGTVLALRCS